MAGTKTWTIGEVLTASDLNGNFTKLPYASSAFTFTQVATLAINTSTTTAVAFPASRFSVAPLVTVSTTINRNEWNFPIRYLKSLKIIFEGKLSE